MSKLLGASLQDRDQAAANRLLRGGAAVVAQWAAHLLAAASPTGSSLSTRGGTLLL
jgi:hypothetical protein